jgi:hypothetical protein
MADKLEITTEGDGDLVLTVGGKRYTDKQTLNLKNAFEKVLGGIEWTKGSIMSMWRMDDGMFKYYSNRTPEQQITDKIHHNKADAALVEGDASIKHRPSRLRPVPPPTLYAKQGSHVPAPHPLNPLSGWGAGSRFGGGKAKNILKLKRTKRKRMKRKGTKRKRTKRKGTKRKRAKRKGTKRKGTSNPYL